MQTTLGRTYDDKKDLSIVQTMAVSVVDELPSHGYLLSI